MINKNEKGFALVLSLVLLLVMSLMGGALIVISSGDHQSNNTSDQYQQAFYVAETGLIEGEKNIINQYMGPWIDTKEITAGKDPTKDEQDAHDLYLTEIEHGGETVGATVYARHIADRSSPRNNELLVETACSISFKNLVRPDAPEELLQVGTNYGLKVTDHVKNKKFYDLIAPIFPSSPEDSEDETPLAAPRVDAIATGTQILQEKNFLRKFRYEFFSVNIGTTPYFGTGSSIKMTATNDQSLGTAYKIYACGMMVEKPETVGTIHAKIIIPLETVIVMPN